MRTTVELPVELMRAAKTRSAETGETLKALLTRAVATELEHPTLRRSQKARVTLPLFGDPSGSRVHLSNADLERALSQTEGAAAALSKPARGAAARPRRRRPRRAR